MELVDVPDSKSGGRKVVRVRPPPPAPSPTLLLGAHVSAAGGVGNAPGNAEDIGAECFQVFTRNQHRWRCPAIGGGEAERFRGECERTATGPTLAHDSYLINLATHEPEKRRRSTEAFLDELARAQQLGIPFLVTHPGAHLGAGVTEGLRRVAENLDRCLDAAGDKNEVVVLLENTAGQGTSLGHEFGQLRDLLGASHHPRRLGICVDTCHAFAAGYDLRTREAYEDTVGQLASAVGLDAVRAWHLNDSRRPLGSHVDRHADIGAGELGLDPFVWLVQDPRWCGRPGILETPGGPERWAEDMARLRSRRPTPGRER